LITILAHWGEAGYDGLHSAWKKCNYINPPYGKEITNWIKMAYHYYQKGSTCVLLIPSRTDTKWFHDYIMKADEIRFIKGRLHFNESKNSAPFPSCIVIFRGRKDY
jgi:site-specific DNA-methyltransferase (adenine-specific)